MRSFRITSLLAGALPLLLLQGGASAAVLDSQNFDGPLDSYLNVLPGWTQTDSRGYIKGEAVHGWAGMTGDGAALFYPYNQRVKSPSLDTSSQDTVHVSLDLRPSDSVQGWGGVFRVYVQDPVTENVSEAVTILLDRASGLLHRTNGFNAGANFVSTIPWVVDEDAQQTLELRLDQVNRTYDLIYSDGTQLYEETGMRWIDLSLGGPTGTFHHMEIQGGSGGGDEQSYPDNWLAFDNYLVTDGEVNVLEGDLNLDGFVGLEDLDIVLGAWNQTVPPADAAADPSGDGYVGLEDLDLVLANWNTGTPPPSNTVVPEPSTMLFVGAGLTTLFRRK